jgi:hypothetical protein
VPRPRGPCPLQRGASLARGTLRFDRTAIPTSKGTDRVGVYSQYVAGSDRHWAGPRRHRVAVAVARPARSWPTAGRRRDPTRRFHDLCTDRDLPSCQHSAVADLLDTRSVTAIVHKGSGSLSAVASRLHGEPLSSARNARDAKPRTGLASRASSASPVRSHWLPARQRVSRRAPLLWARSAQPTPVPRPMPHCTQRQGISRASRSPNALCLRR